MIKFDIENRVAVVTGGAQGFGLAITERFIQSGAKVVIWDIDENEAKKALEKINSKNLSYQIVDVSNFNKINENLTEIIVGNTLEAIIGAIFLDSDFEMAKKITLSILNIDCICLLYFIVHILEINYK